MSDAHDRSEHVLHSIVQTIGERSRMYVVGLTLELSCKRIQKERPAQASAIYSSPVSMIVIPQRG